MKQYVFLLVFFIPLFIYGEEVFCEGSLLLPSPFRVVGSDSCFSPSFAADASTSHRRLEGYLEKFESNEAQLPYHYWRYLRSGRYLSALMVLEEIVLRAEDLDTIARYKGEFEFVVLQAIKDSSLYDPVSAGSSDPVNIDVAGKHFFYILNQMITLFTSAEEDLDDSWLLWKAYTILFSNLKKGIDWEGDNFIRERWNRHVELWKRDALKGYLALFFYFVQGEKTSLPSRDTFLLYLDPIVKIRKRVEKSPGEFEEVARLMARFVLENLSTMPEIEFAEEKKIRNIMEKRLQKDPRKKKKCAYLKEREDLFSGREHIYGSPMNYNRALGIMEGCEIAFNFPFVVTTSKVIIPYEERYLLDLALALYYIRYGGYDRTRATSLISGGIVSSINNYQKGGFSSPFGMELLYAYYTGRLQSLRDAVFLYPLFLEGDTVSGKELMDAATFITDFYLK